jgi:predicted DNA-binding protein (UPF0251 family)
MPRPTKGRRVDFIPEVTFFAPAGGCRRAQGEVLLSIEEAEAIRLKDLEELQQEDCAERMQISRPTFHRVLEAARKKVADALVNGKAIRISGGNYQMARRYFKCCKDGHQWGIPFKGAEGEPIPKCPQCQSDNTQAIPFPRHRMRKGCRWIEAEILKSEGGSKDDR